MKKHPNKDIRAAISYAVSCGWRPVEAGNSSHAYCRLKCRLLHGEHQMSVWSTPKSAQQHARQIIRKVNECIVKGPYL